MVALFLLKKTKGIIQSTFYMLDYVYLKTYYRKYFRKSYLRSTVGQTRLNSVAIIYIERFYANLILQVLVERIIDIFGKRKNRESFMRAVHVLIILLYIRLTRRT